MYLSLQDSDMVVWNDLHRTQQKSSEIHVLRIHPVVEFTKGFIHENVTAGRKFSAPETLTFKIRLWASAERTNIQIYYLRLM